ncbi:hypothetical protein EJ02DRAFT_460493 [Clathrospora elynae]|uniref:Zn(2)-C6 fungal-type domain-containing protein n=1 Tax=Clathrospora elynae TaxID=706981 RepID=A0A6A5S6T8_9PLEO|nr:hypothetical protein EJ02DRAFT_460493 [Clathrospora elynae]
MCTDYELRQSEKGSAPTPIPTKYRLACDSCQHSKIRCGQERPKCRRCAKKGIECVYSPARRAGRPRTRNNSKSSSSVENSASASLKGYLTPTTEHGITIPASGWMSPFAPPSMLSTSENCSSSSSSSNTSTPIMAQTIQMPSPDDMEFSPYQQSDDDFLQGLPDLTGSQCGTPKQTTNCYYPMSPEFHIAPELLNIGFCGAPWEQQQQQQEHEQHQPTSTTMLLDGGLPYFGLLTPEDHQSLHHPDQHQEDTPIPTTSSNSIESCSYAIPPQQQVQPQFPQSVDHAPPSTKSCNCVSTLLDHLSTPSHAPSSSSLASTSAAFSTSRILITCCCTTMACPNACSTRPSTALVICEAIDRALVSLKLDGTSLWTPTLAPIPSYEDGTSSSPSSSSSSSGTSGGNSNDIMLPSSAVDEEHEPLRCGTLSIRGADRRAVVRVLLVKRVLEVQGLLERLRDTLLSGLLVGGDVAVKKPLLALCADVVGEFAKKVAERVETMKLQM